MVCKQRWSSRTTTAREGEEEIMIDRVAEIPFVILRDDRLDFETLGLLVYLLSFSVERQMAEGTVGGSV
jgi:hypothetical protein